MATTKEYSNGEVTVLWKPDLCIHSGKCTKGLPEVFKPKVRPWIQLDNSNTSDIVDTVKACPSGALSYYMNDVGKAEVDSERKNEHMKVEVMKDGPLMVFGSITVQHDDGREEQKTKATAFCRCGNTGNAPFCDGTHSKQ
ncbi:(4Fe-4S)-binding protein [Flavobacteriaceae bacterium TK19130]|nr:(4Fe-4S)-binding protein [Thermobacterium salinum]